MLFFSQQLVFLHQLVLLLPAPVLHHPSAFCHWRGCIHGCTLVSI
uniref:Uncharacterized protein n=1 Tax=Arundo donax TaxID=35708 RepID=A0A0A9C3C2_ARUDO